MIDYGLFEFASPPRTGTTWFVETCQAVGLGDQPHTEQAHEPFRLGPSQATRVTLVRHPCDWLASLYGSIYPMRVCEPMLALCDLSVRLDLTTFSQFVRAVLEWMPGVVGKVFSAFEATHYLRTDHLHQEFPALCREVGFPLTQGLQPACNQRTHQVEWEPQLWSLVEASEGEFIEKYGLGTRTRNL